MSFIGKNKCSYSPMQKRGLISPMLKTEDNKEENKSSANYEGEEGVEGGHRVEIRKKDGTKSYATEMNNAIYVNGTPVSKKDMAKAGQIIRRI